MHLKSEDINIFNFTLSSLIIAANMFFIPQTTKVNLDVCGLTVLERTAKLAGENSLMISSGRRDLTETFSILESRKKREGLNKYPETLSVINEVLLRGTQLDNITYPKNKWYVKAKVEVILRNPKNAPEIMRKLRRARKDFAGYESGHLKGYKVDVPKSFFISKYGKAVGNKRFKSFITLLKKENYKILFEPRAGTHGVLDITLKCSPNGGRD